MIPAKPDDLAQAYANQLDSRLNDPVVHQLQRLPEPLYQWMIQDTTMMLQDGSREHWPTWYVMFLLVERNGGWDASESEADVRTRLNVASGAGFIGGAIMVYRSQGRDDLEEIMREAQRAFAENIEHRPEHHRIR